MDVTRLQTLLGITVLYDQIPIYQARLDSASEHVDSECGEVFSTLTDDVISYDFPPDVEIGVALLVKGMGTDTGLASRTLGDMSVSYFQGESYLSARRYWKKHIKAKMY
jgi:hypothetical protein